LDSGAAACSDTYRTLGELKGGQLGSRCYAQLCEHVAQVEIDRSRAEEQLRGYVTVGQATPDEADDLDLLRGEVVHRGRVSLAGGLARSPQLLSGPIGPWNGTDLLERLESRAQVGPRIDPATRPPQILAESQLGARTVDTMVGSAMQLNRTLELRRSVRAVGRRH
jgi:hypothetical protein